MPQKKTPETSEQQTERFKSAVQAMIDAGELSPTEADASFDTALRGVARLRSQWFEAEEDRESPEK